MARSVLGTLRPMADYPAPVETTVGTVIPDELHPLFPPAGMDMASHPKNLPLGVAAWSQNLIIDPGGSWRVRDGTTLVGATTATTLLHAKSFTTSSNVTWIVRWTDTGVEWLDGSTWRAMTGPTLTGTETTRIAETGWGDLLIFSNGLDGMHAINFTSKTYSLITNAPSACHLTTFNKRVIASVPATGRIQWCVNGDYTNWTSTELGAGYEDLIASAPTTGSEQQSAVIPVSDEIAYVIRSGSVHQMAVTRTVGSPFAFSLFVSSVGSRWPNTCCAVPGGAAFMSDIGVQLVTGGQVNDISAPIRHLWRDTENNNGFRMSQDALRRACMVYSSVDNALFLSAPYLTNINLGPVYRYDFLTGFWGQHDYGWNIKSLSSVQDRYAATIGDFGATDTIGDFSATGAIGDLGVSGYTYGLLLVRGYMSGIFAGNRFVARHAPELSRDENKSVQHDGTMSALNAYIQTASLRPRDASRSAHLHNVTITYQTSHRTSGFNDMYLLMTAYAGDTTNRFFSLNPVADMPQVTSRWATRSVNIPVNLVGQNPYLVIVFASTSETRFLNLTVRISEGAVLGQGSTPR